MRAVELDEHDGDRPMMLGWTNLAQGAGACLSPLIATTIVGFSNVTTVLLLAFALRMVGALVISGKLTVIRVSEPIPVATDA